jgi:hypothetical protein
VLRIFVARGFSFSLRPPYRPHAVATPLSHRGPFLFGRSERTPARAPEAWLTHRPLPAKSPFRTIIDDRLRCVWAILIGLSAVAVTVGVVTIMIHDLIQ